MKISSPPAPLMVTGSSGFVGRAFVQHALGAGWPVCELVRRQGHAPTNAQWRHVMPDMNDRSTAAMKQWDAIVEGVGSVPSTLIHLAARAHVLQESAADPLVRYRLDNVDGSVAVAQAAFERGIKRFVFISSIGAVCDATDPDRPVREDDEPRPVTPYGIAKREAELALQVLADRWGRELVIVRPPLVHGAGAPGNLGRLRKLAGKGIPLPLGSIRNRRSLVHVENLSRVLLACTWHAGAANRTFHVRDAHDYSTPEIAIACGEAIGRSTRVFPFPVPLLRLAARSVGAERQLAQLTQSLAVDDSLVRMLLGVAPLPLNLQV